MTTLDFVLAMWEAKPEKMGPDQITDEVIFKHAWRFRFRTKYGLNEDIVELATQLEWDRRCRGELRGRPEGWE